MTNQFPGSKGASKTSPSVIPPIPAEYFIESAVKAVESARVNHTGVELNERQVAALSLVLNAVLEQQALAAAS